MKMRGMGWVVLSALVVALAGSAVAGAPKHPLQGQTLDFIPSDTGDDAATLRLTISSAEVSNLYGGPTSRGEVEMESDLGKDIITFVRASGKKLAGADILAEPPANATAPPYAFTLSFKEHIVYRMGDNVGPALAAGFTFGLATPATLPVSYVTELTLDVARADGAKASYSCAARFKGGAPRNYRPAPAIWTAMSGSARDQCLTDLLGKMKADQAFFRPAAPPAS